MLDVLAYCRDVNVWTPGVRYAAELAASLGATLTGIHVAPLWPSHEPPGTPPSVMAELVACAQEEVRTAMEADARFGVWARGLGVASTKWHVALGDPTEVLGVAGNWSDLIVIERRIGDRDNTMELLSEVLLSGFVCIAVPENGYALTRFDRIAIAFDGSTASIRALHASTPLLERASHVILIESETEGDAGEAMSSSTFDPRRYLADRGVEVEVAPRDALKATCAEGILEAASRNRADLLVSGAHGKRRLGDCRLDETSNHLLKYTGVPILLAH
jgi:nucleotide-binding universal stress UspA family protein